MFTFRKKIEMPSPAEALPGRAVPIPTAREHYVLRRSLKGPHPDGFDDCNVRHGLLLGRRTEILGVR